MHYSCAIFLVDFVWMEWFIQLKCVNTYTTYLLSVLRIFYFKYPFETKLNDFFYNFKHCPKKIA